MDRLDERLRTLRDMVRLRPDGCELEPYVGVIDEARRELAELRLELNATGQELAELRELAAGSYTVGWTWRDGELVPDEYVLTDEDGPVDLDVDASGLVRAVLERQAGIWVRAAELTPAVLLEQLLAMVPPRYALATSLTERYLAWWHATEEGILAEGSGRDLASAVRAATIALLRGRQRCGTCAHWGSAGDEGGDRECMATELRLRKTAESSCGESWRLAQWLGPEPELPVSPARLVRAALAYVDSIPFPGAGPELELWQAAAELRGIEPEPGDGEDGQ